MVSCAAVRKRYGLNRPWVLKGIDAEVSAGQIVHVGGSNGAGKSTLLRIVSGASVPTDGARELAPGAGVGYVPESTSPPRGLSASRYLRHHARLRGLRDGAGEEVERLTVALRCEHFLAEPLTTLSKGSLRKFSLIQALLGAPRLLVLDEPFTGLDVSAQEVLAGLLAERAREGAAVVFSDHREGGRRMAATDRWEIVAGVVQVEEAGTWEVGESDAEFVFWGGPA